LKAAMSDTYYRDLARCEPMSRAEERARAAALAALRIEHQRLLAEDPQDVERVRAISAALDCARRHFVCANLRLVVKIAGHYNDGTLPFADLIQEGNIGLITALDRFDHSRGVRFCTYASWWIRHRIGRAIANHGRAVRVPNHVAQLSSKLRAERRVFERKHGRAPSIEELVAITGVDAARMSVALQATGRGLSLEARYGDQHGRTIGDALADQRSSSVEELAEARTRGDVARALASLKPIEADILRKRFAFDWDEPMTLRQLGTLHSLSRERIRQLQNKALDKMKRQLAHRAPESVAS